MKRFICILLCALFVLSAFACAKKVTIERPMGSENGQVKIYDSKDKQPDEKAEEVNEPDAEPVDTEPEKTEEPVVEETEEPARFLPLEIKEFGYSIKDGYLYYSVCIHNPNESFYVEFPTFRITARDADNILLGTEEQVLNSIYPQQDVWHAFLGFKVEEAPSKVDVEMLEPNDYNISDVSTAKHPTYIPLTIINSAKRGDKIVGEIQNDNDYDINQAIVTIVFRDAEGKLLGGTSTFVDSVKAKSATPFDESVYSPFSDTYEIYAGSWDY